MPRYTDPAQLLAAQRNGFAKVAANAQALHLGMVRDVERRTKAELLSGTTTTEELARAGHPFGRKRRSRRNFQREAMRGGWRLSSRGSVGIAIPKLPINRQSGDLAGSAAILRIAQPGGGQDVRLAYRAKYAKWTLSEKGTSSTVPRGFVAAKRRIDAAENRKLAYSIRLMTLTVAASSRA